MSFDSKSTKTLICLVGLPRSGKTTFAKKLSQKRGYPIVNPDSIRLALHGKKILREKEPKVWEMTHLMVKSLFIYGYDYVILDSTNYNIENRDTWKDKEWQVVFKIISTSKEVCIQRAQDETDKDIIPIISKMSKHFEPLLDDEILYNENN